MHTSPILSPEKDKETDYINITEFEIVSVEEACSGFSEGWEEVKVLGIEKEEGIYNIKTKNGNAILKNRVYARSSTISLLDKTQTPDCFLNSGSLDHMGQSSFNASAKIGSSFSCGENFPDALRRSEYAGSLISDTNDLSSFSLEPNSPSLISAYFNTSFLLFINSSNAYDGEYRKMLRDFEEEMMSCTGLLRKNETKMFVSNTNLIYAPLCFFDIPSFILPPISSAIGSNGSSSLSCFNISSFQDNCLAFSSMDFLTNPDQFISENLFISSFVSDGTDSVIDTIKNHLVDFWGSKNGTFLRTMFNTSVEKRKYVEIYKDYDFLNTAEVTA
jgi:hypothetical protein